jgi:hypothetical protein
MILRRALERGQPHWRALTIARSIGREGADAALGAGRRPSRVYQASTLEHGPAQARMRLVLRKPRISSGFVLSSHRASPPLAGRARLIIVSSPPRTRQPPTRPARVPKRSGRPVRGKPLVEGVEPSVLHHAAHVCGGIDSLERVPLHQHQVGQLAPPERAQVLIQAQLPRGRGRASPPSGSSSPISNRSRLNMVARPL